MTKKDYYMLTAVLGKVSEAATVNALIVADQLGAINTQWAYYCACKDIAGLLGYELKLENNAFDLKIWDKVCRERIQNLAKKAQDCNEATDHNQEEPEMPVDHYSARRYNG